MQKIKTSIDEPNPCGEMKLGPGWYTSGFGYWFVLTNNEGKILAYSEINKQYYFTEWLNNEDCIVIKSDETETFNLFIDIMKTDLFQTDFPTFNHQLRK